MPEPRPNLLLITTDQQRWDALGYNGNPILETQNLDRLAASGVNFTRGYTTCPTCIAARRTILTGQAPATHGLVGYSEEAPFDPKFTLPQLLRDAGYQTQLVGKLHQMPQRRRFGFDHMILSNGPSFRPDSKWQKENDWIDYLRQVNVPIEPNFHGINGNGRLARPWPLEEHLHQTTWLTSQAIEFMTRKRDPSQPFFLHLSYWAPHPPLIPPRDYFDRYVRRMHEYRPHHGTWVPKSDAWVPGIAPDDKFGPFRLEEIQNAMAGYYGLINHIDDQIQRLLESFYVYGGSRGAEPMYVLFTSDHGEMLGDHHMFRKTVAYEGSAHVPFFVSGRNVPIKKSSSDELVCLEDILPTLCELGGAKIPEGVDGKSLAPILRGEKLKVREDLHGEHTGKTIGHHYLVHKKHKYIWYVDQNEEQIFDLDEDPYERVDISGNRALLKELRSRMSKHLQGRSDFSYDLKKLKPLENGQPAGFWAH